MNIHIDKVLVDDKYRAYVSFETDKAIFRVTLTEEELPSFIARFQVQYSKIKEYNKNV